MATKKTATKQTATKQAATKQAATKQAATKQAATATTPKTAPTPYARPSSGPVCWLMKSEPDVYGIAELERDRTSGWEGVRNYLARNYMRDFMKVGDLVLFYHSNASPSGVAGVARVCGTPVPDPTQFDSKSDYYDGDSAPSSPRWMMVPIAFVERFEEVLPLERLRDEPALSGMPLLARGQRLSVQPVSPQHFHHVLHLAKATTTL